MGTSILHTKMSRMKPNVYQMFVIPKDGVYSVFTDVFLNLQDS